MVDGKWMDDAALGTYLDGRFQRAETTLRSWINPTGDAGPTGDGGFRGESSRYHVFVALNCPGAHRTLLARLFNGLGDHITTSIASPRRSEEGWIFDASGRFSDPERTRTEIDTVNDRVDRHLNNGLYRAGFARTQEVYNEGFDAVFETLDWLES
jgi:glutathionyl-hydroquinone reductase